MAYGKAVLGYTPLQAIVGSGTATNTFAMPTINNCVSFRFQAPDTRDIKTVYVNWASITAAGTVQVRIETDASGKPSGTLYDANASVNITPTAGWQAATFATPPSTNLVAGNIYHVVLITTGTGTTHNLRVSYPIAGGGYYPLNALTATDGSTRTNLVEVTNTVPVCTIVYSDNVEETAGFAGFTTSTTFNVYGTRAAGVKIVIPTGVTASVGGIVLEGMLRNGTPDNLRFRIFSGNSAVAGTTVAIDKNSLTLASGRRIAARFPAAVSLAAGTYRAVIDQVANTSTSGNNWSFYNASNYRSSGLIPTYLAATNTLDITAGTITWVDTATDFPLMALQLEDASSSGGGGGSGARIIGG